jgi:hypothetical protein
MARPVVTDWEGAKQAWMLAYERGEYTLAEHDGIPLPEQKLALAYTYFYNVRRYLRRQPLANSELLYKISRCKLDIFDGTRVRITRRDAAESSTQTSRTLIQNLIAEKVQEERKKLHF